MTFTPADPDYRARFAQSFARQTAMQTLGITAAEIAPGKITLVMPFSERLSQQHGFIHAGVITTGLDSACGYAAMSLMPADAAVLSVEFKVNLLAPAHGDSFVFRGEVLKPGRTITVCEGKAYAITNGREKLIAAMTATMMAIVGRESIQG
ncbi:MAG: PaaI family thioesterase [Rhodospirillaceae bacterium]